MVDIHSSNTVEFRMATGRLRSVAHSLSAIMNRVLPVTLIRFKSGRYRVGYIHPPMVLPLADINSWQALWEAYWKQYNAIRKEGTEYFPGLIVGLNEGGQRVLQMAIGYVPGDDSPIAALSLPLGMSLPAGVVMEVPGARAMHFPVERCEPSGCRAGARLESDFLRALGTAERMTVRFNDAKREPIEVAVSLEGFSAGLAALKAAPQP